MFYSTNESMYSTLPATAYTNSEYVYWHPYWLTIRDCLMGEIAVKRRGKKYLPRLETQTDDEYSAYVERAVFYNATARTVNALVGAVHIRPPIYENLPDSLDLDNVTRDGQSFEAFAKRITREITSMGRYGVLLDAPTNGGDAYFAGYQTEDIVDWATYLDGGRERLVRVLLREVKREGPLGVTTDLKEVYRLLLIGEDGIYRQRVYEGSDPATSSDFVEITPLVNGFPINYIPFTFLGPSDFGTDIERSPILDIALLNLSHYRSYAQLEAGRFYTATPVWAVFLDGGADDDVEYKVGPNVVWQLGNNDKADLIEFSGAGLKYLENALYMKEQQIASLGGKLGAPVKGVAAESSDSVAQRERGEQSFLQSMLTTMSLGMTKLVRELCLWRGTPAPAAKVKFAQDALDLYMSDREIRAITSLWKTGMIGVEVLYAVFRDANILPADMDMNEFREKLPTMTPDTQQKVILEETKARLNRGTIQVQGNVDMRQQRQATSDAQKLAEEAQPEPADDAEDTDETPKPAKKKPVRKVTAA